MRRVEILLHIFLTTLGVSWASPLQFEDYPPIPFFERSVYRARVEDHSIKLLDELISLQNCYFYNFTVVAEADPNKFYIIQDTNNLNCYSNCTLCLNVVVKEGVDTRDVLYDTITLRAISDGGIFNDDTTTTIIIVHSSEYDPYKLVYNINGTEYVILNYFYFKIFLFVIILTGIILLVLEIREVILKYRGKEYDLITEQIHHI